MHTLITGGAGFLGSHLTERLVGDGDWVTVLDDFSSGDPANLAAVAPSPRLQIVHGSAADAVLVSRLTAAVDRVVHLAAPLGPRRIVADGVGTIESAFASTQTVLASAAARRLPVYFASSSEVYGLSERLPFREDDALVFGGTDRPRFSYACGKALGEWLAFAYARERGLPVCVMRLFNTVGPRQDVRHGLVLSTFVAQARAGLPLTIHGDGRQQRCFVHVDDVVTSIVALMANPDALGLAVNVGRDVETTVLALAEHVRRVVAPVPLRFASDAEARADGFEAMRRRVPDLTRLVRLTGYRARHDLERMVADVAAHASATGGRERRGEVVAQGHVVRPANQSVPPQPQRAGDVPESEAADREIAERML